MTSALRLVVVDDDNVRAACNLALKPGQENFVAPVAVSLAEAYVNQDVAWPRLVYDGDTLVGFVPTGEIDDGEVVVVLDLASEDAEGG